jgi:large subunit ribosomal protein L30
MAKLEITLVRGLIGKSDRQRRTAAALGLTKKHQTVTHNDTPSIRGMIDKLHHVLEVKEVK